MNRAGRKPVYESIGHDYARSRRADPRWESQIHAALGDAQTLVNVGAGAGSYEPKHMDVVAVDPSEVMIKQRPPGAAPVVSAYAEHLPFDDKQFDAALAILTIHHWSDALAGLRELKRVANKQVVVTWDPLIFARQFWLVRDYLPEIGERERGLATLEVVEAELNVDKTVALPVAADFRDGIMGAFWRRPEAYLDKTVRAAMSGIALTNPANVELAMNKLRDDIENGRWQSRYKDILQREELDLGYRLVTASA